MTTDTLTAAELADRAEDEAARRADRKLLAETLRWARLKGYTRIREYEGGQFSGYSWVGAYPRVHFNPSGDGTLYCGNGMFTAETAREAVDVLCALGVLPPSMFSAIRTEEIEWSARMKDGRPAFASTFTEGGARRYADEQPSLLAVFTRRVGPWERVD